MIAQCRIAFLNLVMRERYEQLQISGFIGGSNEGIRVVPRYDTDQRLRIIINVVKSPNRSTSFSTEFVFSDDSLCWLVRGLVRE